MLNCHVIKAAGRQKFNYIILYSYHCMAIGLHACAITSTVHNLQYFTHIATQWRIQGGFKVPWKPPFEKDLNPGS